MEKQKVHELYRSYNTMRKRVWELEDALKALIEEHRQFQVADDLQKYEQILKQKFAALNSIDLKLGAEEFLFCKCAS